MMYTAAPMAPMRTTPPTIPTRAPVDRELLVLGDGVVVIGTDGDDDAEDKVVGGGGEADDNTFAPPANDTTWTMLVSWTQT